MTDRSRELHSTEELSTEQAAAVLGVSPTTVVRLVDAGRLPARIEGTSRHFVLGDVLDYRESSATQRREALAEMAREAEASGLYH